MRLKAVALIPALCIGLAAGCSSQTPSSGAAKRVVLPTVSAAPGTKVLCNTALRTPFTIAGDPTGTPPVWGVDLSGRRFEILWPTGFAAVFDSRLTVVDGDGRIVAAGGARISDAGGAAVGDTTFALCSINGRTY